jgi:hypothetical protein
VRRIKRNSDQRTESKAVEKFRAVIDDRTSITVISRPDNTKLIIRIDLSNNYDLQIEASEAPVMNKFVGNPEPYEISMADIKILEEEIFPINESIKKVFGDEKDLDLNKIRLSVGGEKNDYVSIEESDLTVNNVHPTLNGLMEFIHENKESIMGFLNREYINEEGNVIYLNCLKKNLSPNISSIKLKLLSSMQQRGYFLQEVHKYYGIQLYIIIETKQFDDELLYQFLQELGINWEMIYFRRKLSLFDWTGIECERNSDNLKGYIRAKYENLNYFDINNITRIVVKNQLSFKVADKVASLLYGMKKERANQYGDEEYSTTLKKAEIVAATKLACAYLGVKKEIIIDKDISLLEVQKYEEELTNI